MFLLNSTAVENFNRLYSNNCFLKEKSHEQECIKTHKMVKGCRIDTEPCKKALSKKDSPKTLGTRVSCRTGKGLGGQRARQA